MKCRAVERERKPVRTDGKDASLLYGSPIAFLLALLGTAALQVYMFRDFTTWRRPLWMALSGAVLSPLARSCK